MSRLLDLVAEPLFTIACVAIGCGASGSDISLLVERLWHFGSLDGEGFRHTAFGLRRKLAAESKLLITN